MTAVESCVGIAEVPVSLNVTKDSLNGWVGSKGLSAHRVGRPLFVRLSQVDEWSQNSSGAIGTGTPIGQDT